MGRISDKIAGGPNHMEYDQRNEEGSLLETTVFKDAESDENRDGRVKVGFNDVKDALTPRSRAKERVLQRGSPSTKIIV
ncbi:hypothetical protein ZHAS_00000004 [Anopheles sinensis]|uniref:Uncharacterized protein n=1 Tax=Anopheles sinensis TaxID=74873 RepID=A0A084V9S9_ANOSI|nr:hypothetical protein ZHAS_00000004 [Anopheles sinensis]